MSTIGSVTKDNTYGAVFIGFALSCLVLGIVMTQAWTYYHKYPYDRPFYKILVALLLLIEVVDQSFIGHAAYFYSITNWGNPLVLILAPVWTLVVQVLLGAAAGAVVKACFAMRVWRFSNGNIPVTALIVILVIAQLVIASLYTARGLQLESLVQIHQLKVVGSLSLGVGVVTDVVTAAALCFFLRDLRTGYSKDDSLVNRLTLYAVNTGVLTSAVSLATVVLYNVMPDNFIFMACYFVLSKLYLNSFLATLNTRRVTRGRGTDVETATMPTFLMVGKLTRHNLDNADHVYPPSLNAVHPKADDNPRQQTTALEVGTEQEVTVTRDSKIRYGVAV